MDNINLQINGVKRAIGSLEVRLGTMQINGAIGDFTDTEGDFARFCKPLLGLSVSELDSKYYFTSLENWQKIIDTINPITKQFNWIADRRDCDKRAYLITALTSLFFEINTVRPIYNDVYRVGDGQFAYAHYANVFVTDDGQAYLWDADEDGLTTKITTLTPVIGNKCYHLRAVR